MWRRLLGVFELQTPNVKRQTANVIHMQIVLEFDDLSAAKPQTSDPWPQTRNPQPAICNLQSKVIRREWEWKT
jgi:hypothetical protein